MTVPHLGAEQLELLRRYNTPTVSNAIELFDVRPRNTGFLPHFIRCLLPELGVIVGYAVTCQTTAARAGARRLGRGHTGRLPAVCRGRGRAQDRRR